MYNKTVDCWIFHLKLAKSRLIRLVRNKLILATTQYHADSMNFMSGYINFTRNLWPNISHSLKVYHKFILSYKISLYLYNSFVETKNNNFNFNKYIKNSDVNNYKSSQNSYENFSDLENFQCLYNADKYIIE